MPLLASDNLPCNPHHLPMNSFIAALQATHIYKHLGVVALASIGLSAWAADNVWSEAYTPTKGQWLAYEVQRDVEQLTHLWAQRVAVVVTADPKKEAVDIFVTTVKGDGLAEASACEANKSALQQRARRTLRQYDWALNGTVFVTCL